MTGHIKPRGGSVDAYDRSRPKHEHLRYGQRIRLLRVGWLQSKVRFDIRRCTSWHLEVRQFVCGQVVTTTSIDFSIV